MMKNLYNGTYIDHLDELHMKYGPLVCIGPDWVSLSNPNEIRRIQHARSSWERSHAYRGFRSAPGIDSMSTMTDRRRHGKLRSKLEPGYTGKGVLQVHDQIDDHIMKMVGIIHQIYTAASATEHYNQPLDLAKMVIYLLVDITSSLSFGQSFGCVERQGDFHGYIETSENKLPTVLSVAVSPIWRAIMDYPIMNAIIPEGGLLKPIVSIAKSAVAERFGENKKVRQDMLGSFVAQGLTQEQLELETVVQLLGGSETTSTGILNTILCLLTTPAAYRKLQSEIDDALQSGKITTSPVADAEARALPYLQAVIKEGLRLLPPAALIPKASSRGGLVCGLHIPPGVSVDLSIKTAVRDKAIFGEDSGMFRPERWLDVKGPRLSLMDETWRIVFGGPSRWECVGKGLALAQMNKIYVEVSRCLYEVDWHWAFIHLLVLYNTD